MPKNTFENLAIVGAGIAGKNFSGLDQYGFEVFRGEVYSGARRQASLEEICREALEPIQLLLSQLTGRFLTITLGEGLHESIGKLLFEQSVDMSGYPLNVIFDRTSHILEHNDTDIVLLVDRLAEREIISAIVLCPQQFAHDHDLHILGRIQQCALHDLEGTELLVVNGKLKKFLQLSKSAELIDGFPGGSITSCAISDSNSGLISILKLIWCLNNQVIPMAMDLNEFNPLETWSKSPFYVPATSRTWFTPSTANARKGAVVLIDNQSALEFISVYARLTDQVHFNSKAHLETQNLFAFSGNSIEEILNQISIFKGTDFALVNLRQAAHFQYRRWQKNTSATLSACLLASSPEELDREINYALEGIPESVARNSDWRTPGGSVFSIDPLGASSSIAFVYPGAFNSYPGVGQDLFYLFPTLYSGLSEISENIGNLINERQLYPRSFSRLTTSDMEDLERQLTDDPLAMLISGTCLAVVYTYLLRNKFNIHPASSLGYSLGEISMLFASGVWNKADEMSKALRESPLFRTRLAGQQDAVKEYWSQTIGLSEAEIGNLWANYVLMAPFEKVQNAIQKEDRVYITHINTPRQVVIGGHPDGCCHVVDKLKCSSLRAPFNYALHCKAMESEYEALRELHSWPVQNDPGMFLYSAATNRPVPLHQKDIANQVAYGLTHMLDFPSLVESAYTNGARIFIELGAGSNCTRWIDDTLSNKPHAAFSINRKGISDYTAILQLLARLVSHRVPVDLSPVFG